jgi:hypothetical protein
MIRRVLPTALVLCSLCCLPGVASAAAQFYVRGQVGYAMPSLDEINSDIEEREVSVSTVLPGGDWDKFVSTGLFEFEAGCWFRPEFSAGIAMSYQLSSRSHSAAGPVTFAGVPLQESLGEHIQARLFSVSVTPTFWLPGLPGAHAGAQLGMGFGGLSVSGESVLADEFGNYLALHTHEQYSQLAFVAGLLTGYDRALSPGTALSLRVSYLFANFDEMYGRESFLIDSSFVPPSEGASWGRLLNSGGQPMAVDFSGVSVSLGIMVRVP